ncbi:MAG: ABC transporter [Solirubrobacterales bacterium]|nr:ABC transporter [Solirubrobacterales bacterium]
MRTHESGRLVQAALAAITAAAAFGVTACGSDDSASSSSSAEKPAATSTPAAESGKITADSANKGKSIKLGSKNFTESIIIADIYGQALQKAGFTVKYDLNLGLEDVANKAVEDGDIDGYPEYTGTALTALLGVDPSDVPKDEDAAYQEAKKLYKSKFGFTALPQTPFTDSNSLGMTKQKAAELGNPKTISDLKGKSQNLTIAASAECFKRTDCALGFRKVYGLKFKKEIKIDVAQRHEVILKKKADLTVPFTTDGAIAANKEVILKDDKQLFPPYNVTFVLSQKAADKLGPAGQKVIETVQKGLTTPVMSELNSRVDLDKEKPEDVAAEYLKDYL